MHQWLNRILLLSLSALFFVIMRNAYAEYYLVYPEPPHIVVIYGYSHHTHHHRYTHCRHRIVSYHWHHRCHCALYHRHYSTWVPGHWSCYGRWVPGHWRSNYYGVFYAQPAVDSYEDSYDMYDPDMSTGDDDASADPEMQIN